MATALGISSMVLGLLTGIPAILAGRARRRRGDERGGTRAITLGWVGTTFGTVVGGLFFFMMAIVIADIANDLDEPPEMDFTMDTSARTLTVESVEPRAHWEDVWFLGCDGDDRATGRLQPGESVSGCHGTVAVLYYPTNDVVALYEFPARSR